MIQKKHSDRNLSGDVSYRVVSGSGYSQEQGSRHLIDEISQSVNLHQKFIPKGVPKLPEVLVWYPNEPSWQRLYEQRMKGTCYNMKNGSKHVKTEYLKVMNYVL